MRERERKRECVSEREKESVRERESVCVREREFVCVCVREREREREREVTLYSKAVIWRIDGAQFRDHFGPPAVVPSLFSSQIIYSCLRAVLVSFCGKHFTYYAWRCFHTSFQV